MKTFASTQVPADLSGAFARWSSRFNHEVLGAVPKPSLTSLYLIGGFMISSEKDRSSQ